MSRGINAYERMAAEIEKYMIQRAFSAHFFLDYQGIARHILKVEPLPKGVSLIYAKQAGNPCPECGAETREVQLFTSVSRVCPVCDE